MKCSIELEGKVYKQILMFTQLFLKKWWANDKKFPNLKNKTNYWNKRKKEKETDKFIEKFVELIKLFPKKEEQRVEWKYKIKILIDDFVNKVDIISSEDKDILLKHGLLEITQSFINKAKEFNLNMKIEDIGQAMRNVWIMNIIQMLLGERVRLTPSMFGYSMLYPYTDNYLDNPNISEKEKLKISDGFEKRLAGIKKEIHNIYEQKLSNLVNEIESEYNRINYSEVFESLIGINRAQKKSLIQQQKKTAPYETDILGISIEKGGTSVLADAYLVNGKLTQDEAEFFFGYGVLLQLSDDLQDVKEDLQNNHMTIASQLAKKWDLDNITNGLINFNFNLIDNVKCFDVSNIKELKQLISKNCLLLILFAVAKNKRAYSKKYFKQIEQYFPYRTRYMNNFYKRLKNKYSNIKESYNGMPIEKIIMEALN